MNPQICILLPTNSGRSRAASRRLPAADRATLHRVQHPAGVATVTGVCVTLGLIVALISVLQRESTRCFLLLFEARFFFLFIFISFGQGRSDRQNHGCDAKAGQKHKGSSLEKVKTCLSIYSFCWLDVLFECKVKMYEMSASNSLHLPAAHR